MGLGSCMPREAWRLPSPQTLQHEGAPWGGGAGCLLPGCGASVVRRFSRPTARPSGVRPGPATPWLWVRCAGVGTPHQPHSARSCKLALRAARAPRGRPGGGGRGVSCLGVQHPWFGAVPRLTARPSGVRPGPATHWLCVGGGVGVGTRHQPHSARSCELALRAAGAARGRPGRGGVSCLVVGRPWLGALPRRTARPSGVRSGPATHWLWVPCAGAETRHQPHSAHSCELALRAAGAARGRPGGGGLLPGSGPSEAGRSPIPDRPSFGRAA